MKNFLKMYLLSVRKRYNTLQCIYACILAVAEPFGKLKNLIECWIATIKLSRPILLKVIQLLDIFDNIQNCYSSSAYLRVEIDLDSMNLFELFSPSIGDHFLNC